jgi:F0F1-type ATP synthase membrane subunit c/vacuolar-type H+-ATPase subunit K
MEKQGPNTELIFKNMAMVWLALFSSQLMFAIVCYVAKPELLKFDLAAPPLGTEPLMVIVFAVLGLFLIAASFVMKANFNRKAVDQQSAGLVQTGMIVACAMCEAASIFGLVLAFSHSYQYFFFWIAAAMAGMAFHFPSRTKIMNASLGKRL